MPIRGESVGNAYIKVTADGTSIPRDIEREFDRVDQVADKHGTRFAQRFEEAINAELAKHDSNSLDNALAQSLGGPHAVNQFFSGAEWNRVKTRFNQEFGSLGDDEAKAMEDHFRQSGSLQGIEESIAGVSDRINTRIRTNAEELARDTERINALIERRIRSNIESTARDTENALRGARLEFLRFGRDIQSGERDIHTFARIGNSIDRIAVGVGRAFGKGSRNNFLNFVGSFTQHATELIGVPAKIAGNLQELVGGFNEARAAGEGIFKSFTSGFDVMAKDAEGGESALSSFLSAGIVGFPILALAGLALVGVLSIVASLISGIAAALIALVGSIAFGLVGIIAPLAGLLAPVAIAIGGVAAGILVLTKNKDRLAAFKKEIAPVIDGLKGIGNAVDSGFASRLHGQLSSVVGDLKAMDPLAHRIGAAFGNLTSEFLKSFQSKEANRFFRVMSTFVPEVITKLGHATGNFAASLGDIFVDLVPTARHFLNYLDGITADFHKWVRENPHTIKQFFHDAADSVKAIGHFLGPVVRLLGTLLSSGRGSGDDIFTSLGNNVDKFNTFLKNNPKGLADFFANGKQVAADLGNIVIQVSRLFDALDTPEGRKNLHEVLTLLTLIGRLAGPLNFLAGTVLPKLFNVLSPPFPGVGFLLTHFSELKQVVHLLGHDIGVAGGKIGDFFHKLGSGGGFGLLEIKPPSVTWIPGVLKKINGLWNDIITGAGHLATTLGNKAGEFGSAVGTWGRHMATAAAKIPGKIVNFFVGLGSRIASAIGDIVLHIKLPHIPGIGGSVLNEALSKLPHAAGGVFDKATLGIFGEAGAEALVPLTGPLSQVDPSVRELSAIARGLKSGTSTVTTTPGKTVNVEQHITTIATDPRAAAQEFLNHLTAVVA